MRKDAKCVGACGVRRSVSVKLGLKFFFKYLVSGFFGKEKGNGRFGDLG